MSRLEPAELELFHELPEAPFCVDCGAGHGEWAEALFGARPKAWVWCFEPHPQSAAVCRRVLKGRNAIVHQLAVSDRNGSRILHVDGDAWNFGSSIHRRAHHRGGALEVQAVTLASIAPARVDLLKLDVEGHELPALGGLGDLRPRIIQFEHGNTWQDAGYRIEDAYRLLEAMGYECSPFVPPAVGVFCNVVARQKR
jgi:FkbM family methyltransferase